MKPLNLQFLPLTFIDSAEKIKEQIINTAVFASLLEEHSVTNLKHYLESTQYGYTASSSEQGDYKFLRITDINHGAVEWDNVPFCSGSDVEKYLLKSNDILVARTGGTTGKSHLVTNPPNNAVFASYLIRLRPEQHTNPLFIAAFLNSYLFWNQVVAMKSGSAQPNVNAEKLKELILPKCDLATQNRVVDYIKNPETMDSDLRQRVSTVVEKYDTLNGLLKTTSWQLVLVSQLRKALFREAMQGQLLPQDPTDEPADLLLQKLQAAKTEPGKGGKSNGVTLFAKETEALDGPFEIPKSWVWCKLGSAGELKRGKSKHRPRNDSRLFDGGTYPFIQTGDVSKAKFNQDLITTVNGYYNDFGLKQSEMQKKGTLCITIAANIAECGFLSIDACAPDSIVCFASVDKYAEKYVYYYLKIAKEELERFAPATAQKNINLGILNELLIPLPPLAEQRRIVEKLEKLLQHCDTLEQRIRESRRMAEQLLQTALREALAPPASAIDYSEQKEPQLAATEILASTPSRRGRPRRPSFSLENPPVDLFSDLFTTE